MLASSKAHLVHRIYRKRRRCRTLQHIDLPFFSDRICLVGSNPSHLIKSNVLHNDIRRYCRPEKWCEEGNNTVICPLYAAICNKSTNSLCSSGEYVNDVRIEQGVPGLKQWQLSGKSSLIRGIY